MTYLTGRITGCVVYLPVFRLYYIKRWLNAYKIIAEKGKKKIDNRTRTTIYRVSVVLYGLDLLFTQLRLRTKRDATENRFIRI